MIVAPNTLSDPTYVYNRLVDFAGAVDTARRDLAPATPPAPPAPPPAPDPTNKDPAYQLLNRGGSLRVHNEQQAAAAAAPRNNRSGGTRNVTGQDLADAYWLLREFGYEPEAGNKKLPSPEAVTPFLPGAQLDAGQRVLDETALLRALNFGTAGGQQLANGGGFEFPGFGPGWGTPMPTGSTMSAQDRANMAILQNAMLGSRLGGVM